MDQGSLVREETDAGLDLIRRLDPSFPVKVAFWARDREEGPWYLYIASDRIDDRSLDAAYAEVLRLAEALASPDLDAFRVKLIPTSDPLAQAALEIHRRYPRAIATRFNGKSFGALGVDGVYLYPASITVPMS